MRYRCLVVGSPRIDAGKYLDLRSPVRQVESGILDNTFNAETLFSVPHHKRLIVQWGRRAIQLDEFYAAPYLGMLTELILLLKRAQ